MEQQAHGKAPDSAVKRFKPPVRAFYAYLQHRTRALQARLDDLKYRKESGDALPVPPPLLRHRVHGVLGVKSFIRRGMICAQNITDLLKSVDRELNSFGRVLDFGCGCGRVLRHFRDYADRGRLDGTDIDREAISWCKKHLDMARFEANDALPPTRYADATFDLIYAISVFTHLDEEMQLAWLGELKRIAKPGGILILSVHGEFAGAGLPEKSKARIAEKGILFSVGQTGKFKLDGLPDFYQHAFHSKDYIYRTWSSFFEVHSYVERGINDHQDAVILINR